MAGLWEKAPIARVDERRFTAYRISADEQEGGQDDPLEPPHNRAPTLAALFCRPFHPRAEPVSAIPDPDQAAHTELVNNMKVRHPKDLSKPANCAVLFVETRFSQAFQMTKRAAIKLVTRQCGGLSFA